MTDIAATTDLDGSDPSFVTPDGSRLTIRAPGYDLSLPWTASIRIQTKRPYSGTPSGLQLRGLHVARVGNYDRVIEDVLDGRIVHRVDGQGGQFLIARGSHPQGVVLWRGRWHEAAAWLPDPTVPGSIALRYFDGLRFTDSPRGIVVRAALPHLHEIETDWAAKRIPGVGFLDIRKASTALSSIPAWAGATVPTGEVWRRHSPTDQEPEAHVLLHASRTTVTWITGERATRSLEAPRVAFLEHLAELSWSAN